MIDLACGPSFGTLRARQRQASARPQVLTRDSFVTSSLVLTTFVASIGPARRAVAIDPMGALHDE